MTGVFFGCTLLNNEELKVSFLNLLNKIGLSYEPLGVDECCGIPLILSGFLNEAKSHGKKVKNIIEKKNIDKIITHCPHCYIAFKHEYPEKLGISIDASVLHITQFIWDLIRKGELKIKKEFNRKVVYHDPCYLGRQGDGIYDEPRNILKSIQGLEILEFEQNRDKSTCCGGGGLLRAFLPKLSVEVAKEKIELQTPQNVDGIVSCCPFCDINLKEGADEIKTKIKVYDLVNILEEAL